LLEAREIDETPVSLFRTLNGPEPFRTRDGVTGDSVVACVGTKSRGGLVRYDFNGATTIPGTDGLFLQFPVVDQECTFDGDAAGDPSERFLARDADQNWFAVVDQAVIPIDLPNVLVLRWVSCDELLMWDEIEGAYFVASYDTPDQRSLVCSIQECPAPALLPGSDTILAHALTTTHPETGLPVSYVAIAGRQQVLLYERIDGGAWARRQPIESPDGRYPYLRSVQLFEWINDDAATPRPEMWLSGYVSRGTSLFSPSVVFIRQTNLFNESAPPTYQLFGDGGWSWLSDPETMLLANDRLAVYWYDFLAETTLLQVVEPFSGP
jgi:hypothetical protein